MGNDSYLDLIKELERRGVIRGKVEPDSAALPDKLLELIKFAQGKSAERAQFGQMMHSIIPPTKIDGVFYIAWLTEEGSTIVISNKKSSMCKDDFSLILRVLHEAASKVAADGSPVFMEKLNADSGEVEGMVDLGVSVPHIK